MKKTCNFIQVQDSTSFFCLPRLTCCKLQQSSQIVFPKTPWCPLGHHGSSGRKPNFVCIARASQEIRLVMHPADRGTGRGLIVCTVRARHQLSVPRRQLMFCNQYFTYSSFSNNSLKVLYSKSCPSTLWKRNTTNWCPIFSERCFVHPISKPETGFSLETTDVFICSLPRYASPFLGAWDWCHGFDTKFDTCLCLQHHRGTILPSHTWFCDECDLSKEIETSWRGAVWWFYMWKIHLVILLLGQWDSHM